MTLLRAQDISRYASVETEACLSKKGVAARTRDILIGEFAGDCTRKALHLPGILVYAVMFFGILGRIIFSLANLLCGYSKVQ